MPLFLPKCLSPNTSVQSGWVWRLKKALGLLAFQAGHFRLPNAFACAKQGWRSHTITQASQNCPSPRNQAVLANRTNDVPRGH